MKCNILKNYLQSNNKIYLKINFVDYFGRKNAYESVTMSEHRMVQKKID